MVEFENDASIMKKKWLIKITEYDDIFYDSVEKVYRYRMHCPHCGVVSGCKCYYDLDVLLSDIFNEIADFCCSAKCCLLMGEWDELEEVMCTTGVQYKKVEDLTEEKALEVLNILTEDMDFDLPSGEMCSS